jgi:hypothetical protein
MTTFLKQHSGLQGITIQTREDTLLDTLAEYHHKTLKKLWVEVCEGTSTAAFTHTLSKFSFVKEVILYAQEATLFTQELFDVFTGLPCLEYVPSILYLSPNFRVVPFQPLISPVSPFRALKFACHDRCDGQITIAHPTLHNLDLHKLIVQHLTIQCPNLTEIQLPVDISDPDNAMQLYEQCFPGQLIVCVRCGKELRSFHVSPNETTTELSARVAQKFRMSYGKLVLRGKSLQPDVSCSKVLKAGCLLQFLSL